MGEWCFLSTGTWKQAGWERTQSHKKTSRGQNLSSVMYKRREECSQHGSRWNRWGLYVGSGVQGQTGPWGHLDSWERSWLAWTQGHEDYWLQSEESVSRRHSFQHSQWKRRGPFVWLWKQRTPRPLLIQVVCVFVQRGHSEGDWCSERCVCDQHWDFLLSQYLCGLQKTMIPIIYDYSLYLLWIIFWSFASIELLL